jgi:hypothetical protein
MMRAGDLPQYWSCGESGPTIVRSLEAKLAFFGDSWFRPHSRMLT